MMFYFGSAGCAASNRPELRAAVERLKVRLWNVAKREAMSFVSVGVALDWIPARGMEHLAKFGPFDELAAGHNWGNMLALDYMWPAETDTTRTPQVLVYRRMFTAEADSGGALHVAHSNVELLAAASGADRIIHWSGQQHALPVLAHSTQRN